MYEALIAHLRECAKLDPSENTLSEAADAIEELVGKTDRMRWISVEERLPEPHENVLVWRYSEDLDDAYHTTAQRLSYGDWIVSGVTHWMPLPEPPKEET